jgi:hypothetical protein
MLPHRDGRGERRGPSVGPVAETEARERIARRLRRQAAAPSSPLYSHLLTKGAEDVERGGAVWQVLAPEADTTYGSNVALRFMGALHRLVLSGQAEALARHYPSTGGDGDAESAWRALLDLVREQQERIAALVREPVQTNEVGRCAALYPALASVGNAGLAVRLVEIGASAGLNLRLDRYRYPTADGRWGNGASTVEIRASYRGSPPVTGAPVIAERFGCDRNPLDPAEPADRLRLLSFVWADNLERLRLLSAALEAAADDPVSVQQAPAREWLPGVLADLPDGAVTVVMQSIVWQYLTPEERDHLVATMEDAGARATPSSPVAWLRFEPGETPERGAEVRVRRWPGGADRLLAIAGYHGDPVEWQ